MPDVIFLHERMLEGESFADFSIRRNHPQAPFYSSFVLAFDSRFKHPDIANRATGIIPRITGKVVPRTNDWRFYWRAITTIHGLKKGLRRLCNLLLWIRYRFLGDACRAQTHTAKGYQCKSGEGDGVNERF